MLTGTIDEIQGKLYVKYVTTLYSEPTQQTIWWEIHTVKRNAYAPAFPQAGDLVTSSSCDSSDFGNTHYRVYVKGDNAAKVERTPVSCPKTRGKPSRWNDGRWEKLTARGWVAA